MAAKTTVKVATLTGAAKDDLLNATITGLADLNVLSNDPGAARLYSLSQDAAALAGTTQFPVLTTVTLQSGASISINADGTIHYDATAMQHALQALAEGENFTDSFVYTVRMANGALSSATATVTIAGVNDAPTLAAITPVTVNDTAADDTPVPFTGQLVGADVDHGAVLAYSLAEGVDGTSDYGTLTLNAAGQYAFAVDSAALNALADGESDTVSFGVLVTDEHGAAAAQTIQFNLVGANDTAEITGGEAGAVTEDGTLTVGGTLTVSDRDHDQSLFIAADADSFYGHFTFGTDGVWSYLLDNTNADVQALNSNGSLTDSLIVSSLDGSATETVSVTINGADELVVVVPPAPNLSVPFPINNGQTNLNHVQYVNGFDSNDYLDPVGNGTYVPGSIHNHVSGLDFNTTGNDSTADIHFSAGPNTATVTVVLVGYADLTAEQIH